MAFTTLGHTEVIKGLIKYIGVRRVIGFVLTFGSKDLIQFYTLDQWPLLLKM